MYNTTGENGQPQQIIYQGPAQPPPPQPVAVAVSAPPGIAPTTVTTAVPVPIPIPVTVANASSTPGGKGKKRKAGGGGGHKENAVLTDTVEDLPCAPDDEDLNTPYPCEQCNKTIKGRVMLQAHHYQVLKSIHVYCSCNL